MGRSTFSGPVRAAPKPHLAGVMAQQLVIDTSVAGAVQGTLPAGVIIQSLVCDTADAVGVSVTIADANGNTVTIASLTAGDIVTTTPTMMTGPATITVNAGVAGSKSYISYIMHDATNGVNN